MHALREYNADDAVITYPLRQLGLQAVQQFVPLLSQLVDRCLTLISGENFVNAVGAEECTAIGGAANGARCPAHACAVCFWCSCCPQGAVVPMLALCSRQQPLTRTNAT